MPFKGLSIVSLKDFKVLFNAFQGPISLDLDKNETARSCIAIVFSFQVRVSWEGLKAMLPV